MIKELSFEEADAVCGGQFARTLVIEPSPLGPDGLVTLGSPLGPNAKNADPCAQIVRGRPLCQVA